MNNHTNDKTIESIISGKDVLFITTKGIDYIRNSQEIRLLNDHARKVEIISSSAKSYFSRIIYVWAHAKKSIIKDYEVVLIGFAPQLVLPFLSNRFRGKYIVIDFFISLYDTMVFDRKMISPSGIIAKLVHHLDSKTIQLANHIITDTRAHSKYFIKEFVGEDIKFETLYLEADKSIYFPRIPHKPKDLANKYVVLYFGSILPLQGVSVIVEAIVEFDNNDDVFFDIIGPMPSKYIVSNLSNVRYTSWLSQEELAERISYADLCLAGHFDGAIEKASRTIPGKAYIYEMMGKEMILGDGEANHELFEEDLKHHFVERGNPKKLAEKIRECKDHYGK